MFKEKFIDSGKVFYSNLIPELEHFFTTRDSSLNSEENKKLTAKYLGVEYSNLISPSQTHSSNIDFAKIGKTDYPKTDALILTNKEQGVFLKFADCVPVIIYDKEKNIGAIAHAGWRGTVAKIVPKTIQKITSDYSNIYVVIGPSIGSCCYNVGEEVINGVKNSVKDYSKLLKGMFVDLKLTNAQQSIELGVPSENIDICPYCTSCRNDLFFSYRKENETSNRHNAVIKLNN